MGRALLTREVSRLARNCADWHPLLEICALTETLILDEDGVYDDLPGAFPELKVHDYAGDLGGPLVIDGATLHNASREGGLNIFDISDPESPITAFQGDLALGEAAFVTALHGDYLEGGSASGLLVLDVSDRASPQLVATDPSVSLTGGGLFIAADLAFVVGNDQLHVYDLANPTAPQRLGSLELPGAESVWVIGSRAYVLSYHLEDGLNIVDASGPSAATSSSATAGCSTPREDRLQAGPTTTTRATSSPRSANESPRTGPPNPGPVGGRGARRRARRRTSVARRHAACPSGPPSDGTWQPIPIQPREHTEEPIALATPARYARLVRTAGWLAVLCLSACGAGPQVAPPERKTTETSPAASAPTAQPLAASSQAPGLTVDVPGASLAADVPAVAARAAAAAGLSAPCVLIWGDLAAPPSSFRPTTLAVDGRPILRGWLGCGEATFGVTRLEPRVHQLAMVEWDRGALRARHPSGPGSSPVDLARADALAAAEDPGQRTFALFGVDPADRSSTVRDLTAALQGLPRAFLLVQWPLGSSAPPTDPTPPSAAIAPPPPHVAPFRRALPSASRSR